MTDSSHSAEELFAEFLSSLQEGALVDFDRWVSEQGAQEAELRELLAGDQALQEFVELERQESAGPSSPSGPAFFRETIRTGAPAGFDTAAAAGDVIGDFRLLAPLGSGGMGQVWEASQLSLNRRVALKLIRPGSERPQVLEMFAREARAGGRLSHPAIVSVYGFGVSRGVHWIAMELVPGGCTLRDFIDRMRGEVELPRGYYQKVAQLVAELTDALQTAHDAKVIHRDIKPPNVLITEDDRPMLTDFGLARITDETALSQTGEFAGTYLYMSPEQVAANRMGIDHRTDVFSLGVLLYELLGLVRPFDGDTTHQVAEKILTHDPPDLRTVRSRVPIELAVIAGKALEKRRDDRFQSMTELGDELRRFLANEPIVTRPPGVLRRVHKWCERHPTITAAVTVLVFGLFATGAATIWALSNARVARAEEGRVKRLSGDDKLGGILAEASSDALWPATPAQLPALRELMTNAERVGASLHPNEESGDPGHHALLADLTARGRKVSGSPRERTELERSEHAYLVAALDAAQRAQAVRDGRVEVARVTPAPDDRTRAFIYPCRDALALVAPQRVVFGREAEGLARARELRDRASYSREAWLAFAVWCEASLANGLEEHALAELGSFGATLEPREAGALAAFAREFEPRAAQARDQGAAQHPGLNARIAALDARLLGEDGWEFDDVNERWWHRRMVEMIAGLERLTDPLTGPLYGVSPEFGQGIQRRIELAEMIGESSREGDAARDAWARAIASIADTGECPSYAGLRIAPQTGLLPIGRDPGSGLWEFAHLGSGEAARRGADGSLARRHETGVVLVLLPGNGELAPFFLSKYELTQGQWIGCMGENPSEFVPGGVIEPGVTLLHPVESVDWHAARRVCVRLGLALPSRAQWCYAAGWDSEESEDAPIVEPRLTANLFENLWEDAPADTEYDGYSRHAPVGSFPPDAFGLHDMRGNVSEWSADAGAPISAQDLRSPYRAESRVMLGSGWYSGNHSKETFEVDLAPSYVSNDLGLRPARALDM